MKKIFGFSCGELFLAVKLLIFMTAFAVQAQQTPVLSHYYYHPYLLNPAAAGRSEFTHAYLFYRQQWVGIPGSPQTQAFTIDGPLTEESNVGLGLSVINDESDVVGRLSALLSSSYNVQFSEDHSLDFGLSLGIIRNRINFDKIRGDAADPGLLQNRETRTVLDGNAGITYHFKKLQLGFVTEQLFNRKFTYENAADFREMTYVLVRHYTGAVQYSFMLNNNLELRPMVVLRSAQGLPSQFDVNAMVKLYDRYWANVAYRHRSGIALALGANISNRLIAGYNYELPTSDLRHTTSGSHEVMIGIRFNKSGGVRVKQEKPTTNRKLDDITKSTNAQFEKLDELQQKNEMLNQQLQEYKQVIEQQNSEIEKLKTSVSMSDEELKTLIERVKVDLQTEKTFDKTYSYYLVIGAVRTFEEAKAFQKAIMRETKLQPQIIQNDNKTWYFIYSDELQSASEARKKIRHLDNNNVRQYIIGNPWVYKTLKQN